MSDKFGDRIKSYERCSDNILPINTPIIIRLDGNSFSKLTKRLKFKKPFDDTFRLAMENAMKAVLDYTGAKLGYSQSDEITLLIINKQNQLFLGNRISKICSICAAIASNAFNKSFESETDAVFDCRAFTVPECEVSNVFLWRQLDAWKNCVYSYAFWNYINLGNSNKKTHSLLKNKNLKSLNEFIYKELNFNINDLESKFKRGFCISRRTIDVPVSDLPLESQKFLKGKSSIKRNKIITDLNIPLFNEDRDYIESYLKY